jgi:hypothetical protein
MIFDRGLLPANHRAPATHTEGVEMIAHGKSRRADRSRRIDIVRTRLSMQILEDRITPDVSVNNNAGKARTK